MDVVYLSSSIIIIIVYLRRVYKSNNSNTEQTAISRTIRQHDVLITAHKN